MAVSILKERNTSSVGTVTLGATKEQRGTRSKTIVVGGETALPFLHFEGALPNRPIIAMEVVDRIPEEWDPLCKELILDVMMDPAAWAQKCVKEFGADAIYLKLQSCDPELGNSTADACVITVKKVLAAVDVPIIVVGCGIAEIDNVIIPAVAEGCAGENLLLGVAAQENYKTIVAACMVHKHAVIACSPLDINMCKQLNILIHEMGLPLDKIIIDPSIGGLGYGMEYAYSILERARIGTLGGDKMLSMPTIGQIGHEAWRAKEALASEEDFSDWGNQEDRGILWEAMTATGLLQAGMNILVMRHPKSVALVQKNIAELMEDNNY